MKVGTSALICLFLGFLAWFMGRDPSAWFAATIVIGAMKGGAT